MGDTPKSMEDLVMPKKIVPLTDIKVKATKPSTKPLKLFDGGGLFLLVTPTGGKLWRLKYRFGGTEKLLTLGTLSLTALMEPGMIGLMEPGEPGDFAFLDGVIFWSFVTLFFSRIVYRSGPVLASGNFCRRGSTGRRCA